MTKQGRPIKTKIKKAIAGLLAKDFTYSQIQGMLNMKSRQLVRYHALNGFVDNIDKNSLDKENKKV